LHYQIKSYVHPQVVEATYTVSINMCVARVYLEASLTYCTHWLHGLPQGCQIVLGTTFQNEKTYTKMGNGKHIYVNDHKIYQKLMKYTKWPWNIPTFSISRPSKICKYIYQNLGFLVWKYTIWQPCVHGTKIEIERRIQSKGLDINDTLFKHGKICEKLIIGKIDLWIKKNL
jgi:hypothetical protein